MRSLAITLLLLLAAPAFAGDHKVGTNVNISGIVTTDSPADEECLTYEATGTTGEWEPCGDADSISFGGTNPAVEATGTTVNIDPDETGNTDFFFSLTQLYLSPFATGGICSEGDTADTFETCFPGVDLAALEREWLRFVTAIDLDD